MNQGSDEQVRKLVKNYVSRKKLTFLNVLDPKSLTAQEYGAQGIPVTFFINRQGKAVAVASGYRPWDSKEGLLMLEQLMSAGATTKTGKSKI